MKSMKRKLTDSSNDSKRPKIKTDLILEQGFINYMSVPSLESIAIVNVAATLCLQSDIKEIRRQPQHIGRNDPAIMKVASELSQLSFRDALLQMMILHPIKDDSDCSISVDIKNSEIFNQIEKNVFNKLSLLPLPNLLKIKVFDVVRPMEFQILKWENTDHGDIDYTIPIHWSSLGTIDKVKTWEQVIDKDPGKFINSIYKSACTYCLEDSIPNLWAKLPEKIQNKYLCGKMIYRNYDTHLIAYWTNIAVNQLPGFMTKIKPSDHKNIYNCSHSVHKNMFMLALSEGNTLAVKYFWYKLTAEEISSNLSQWVNALVQSMTDNQTCFQVTNPNADVLFFLLSKMNDADQQSEVFQKYSSLILNSLFLNWPWQRFLFPTIRAMWNFLDKKVYVQLLTNIVYEIENKSAYKLLSDLWCDSPVHLKKSFIHYIATNSPRRVNMLEKVLAIKDVETINLILNDGDTDVEDKLKIIISVIIHRSLFLVMYPDKLPLFNKLIAETISQESEIWKLKKRIAIIQGKDLCFKWILSNNLQMVDKFCNWISTSQDQIDYFKNNILDKSRITYSLLEEGNYELVNHFLNWFFGSEQEIKQFKKEFATSNPIRIVQLGYYSNFCSFEKVVAWCLGSEQEIDEFKSDILHSNEISDIIFRCIAIGPSGFIDKLICWCCRSNEEMKQFKAGFVPSEKGMALLQRFVSNDGIVCSFNNLEWIRKFVKWFSPLENELMIQLKEKITTSINFHDKKTLGVDFFIIEEKDLFCLLDNHDYTVGNKESSNDNWSDGDHDTSNFEDAFVVLTEILNKVEGGLLEESLL